MIKKVIALLEQIGIGSVDILLIERMKGLTNANFRVKTHDDEVVVRISSAARAKAHGMCRDTEAQILPIAHAEELGVDVLAYELPDGHLVTRKVTTGTYDEAPERFMLPDVLATIVKRVKRIHQLPPVDHVFDPIGKANRTVVLAEDAGIELPEATQRLLHKAQDIKERWGTTDPSSLTLCHNDLFSVNILQTTPPLFIDWEFVGMGDPFFDLATLLVACDDAHPLGLDHRRIALTAYCGEATGDRLKHLDDMLFVVRLHAALWAVVQQSLGVTEPEGFSYARYTEYVLNRLINEL